MPTGAWTSETDRPLTPESGFITLGGNSIVNYKNFENPATPGAPAIINTTLANDVSYIARGSNINTVTLGQGPVINGVQSQTYYSTGSSTPLFTPTDWINKSNVTIQDADGNDTLLVNFNNGDPLSASGLTFNGGTGKNSVTITGLTTGNNFLLTGSGVSDPTAGVGSLSVQNVANVVINGGGSGANTFTVNGWTSAVTVNGGTGTNSVIVQSAVGIGVNGNLVGDSGGLGMHLNGIQSTTLQGTTGPVVFTVNAWTVGGLTLSGGSGNNVYNIGTSQTGNLDTIIENIGIAAAGTSNAIILYDEKNIDFASYTITSTSMTSTGFPITRAFAGVTVNSGTISSVTLDSNPQGGDIYTTPSTTTAFTFNGDSSALPNTMFFTPVASPPSATLFLTSGNSWNPGGANSGLYLFPTDKPVQFQNMQYSTATETPGAINAVSAGPGPGSQTNVNIINSVSGQVLATFSNIYPGYTGGVQTAIGYVTPNGHPDLIVTGVSQAPMVKVYDILTGGLVEQFMAEPSSYYYGLRVAVGDVTGNGKQDIITSPVVGPANVNVFLNTGSATTPFTAYSSSTPTIKAFSSFTNYEGGTGGLAVGSLSGGVGEIVVGSGIGIAAQAEVFNYATNKTSSMPVATVLPMFSASVTGGLAVAVADVVGDGSSDLVMGAGSNGGSLVDVLNGTTMAQNQFTAFTTAQGNNAALSLAIAKISGAYDILVAQGATGTSHELEQFTYNGTPPAAPAVDTIMESLSWLQGGINLD